MNAPITAPAIVEEQLDLTPVPTPADELLDAARLFKRIFDATQRNVNTINDLRQTVKDLKQQMVDAMEAGDDIQIISRDYRNANNKIDKLIELDNDMSRQSSDIKQKISQIIGG